jgi:hypothetical protein
MRKLVLLFGLVASATGLSVRAQDVEAGCQGVNLEVVECAGRRADATGGMQDRIYHIVMDALIAGGDDHVDPLAERFFGFLEYRFLNRSSNGPNTGMRSAKWRKNYTSEALARLWAGRNACSS